jgi:hypothetical protein
VTPDWTSPASVNTGWLGGESRCCTDPFNLFVVICLELRGREHPERGVPSAAVKTLMYSKTSVASSALVGHDPR